MAAIWIGSWWVGTAAERAALDSKYLSKGMRYFESDTNKSFIWNGSSWDELAAGAAVTIEIQEDDVKVADADTVNFEGGGGKVTDEGGGKVTVDITPGAGGGAWTLIEDIHLAGDGGIDFQSIPDTYKHLKIIASLRSDRAAVSDAVYIRFNNDSGNNYDFTRQLSRAAGPLTAEGIGVSYMYNGCVAATGPANVFDGSEILIPDYTDTGNQKTCTVQGTLKQANTPGNVFILTSAGWWRNTAAISRITLSPELGTNFKAGSRASLYGIS